ncbi:MAG TPA: ABC transporter ATP-binding protein [Clostridiales bacterium]|jgi:NitT/TauT family transport system ATP-binding protein|nr:ABC transporter ATP-binding protein [Clostridiales bacterium]
MDIKVNNICKSFNGQQILDKVTMSFPNGSTTCIMGASGVGKTTLINILMGLLKPDSGEITGLSGKHISAVFQEDRLIENWDAVRNVMLVSGKDVTEEKVERHLSDVSLTEYKGKPVRDLSGGMRRRVAIVRALLSDYDLLVMDEPFKGLDDELKKQVISYVKENTNGQTLIIITHDKEEAKLLQAEIVVLD